MAVDFQDRCEWKSHLIAEFHKTDLDIFVVSPISWQTDTVTLWYEDELRGGSSFCFFVWFLDCF